MTQSVQYWCVIETETFLEINTNNSSSKLICNYENKNSKRERERETERERERGETIKEKKYRHDIANKDKEKVPMKQSNSWGFLNKEGKQGKRGKLFGTLCLKQVAQNIYTHKSAKSNKNRLYLKGKLNK